MCVLCTYAWPSAETSIIFRRRNKKAVVILHGSLTATKKLEGGRLCVGTSPFDCTHSQAESTLRRGLSFSLLGVVCRGVFSLAAEHKCVCLYTKNTALMHGERELLKKEEDMQSCVAS